MTAKRFTNIEHDYENAWIKCNDDGDFMIYAIYKELDESLPSLEDLLNGLAEENEQLRTALKELREIGDYQADRIQELNDENEQLKQYKQAVSDVLRSWSQKNLTAKQLQVVIAIMEELNILGDVE